MISGAASGRSSNKTAKTSHNKENHDDLDYNDDLQVVQKENKNESKVQSCKPQLTTAVKQNKKTGLKLSDSNSSTKSPTQVSREQHNKRRRQSTVILLFLLTSITLIARVKWKPHQ